MIRVLWAEPGDTPDPGATDLGRAILQARDHRAGRSRDGGGEDAAVVVEIDREAILDAIDMLDRIYDGVPAHGGLRACGA